ncbi:MAG TPA: DUF2306 domain-containing protein [Vicinamibacterales bacterium]
MSQATVIDMPGRSPGVGRGVIATLGIASVIALIFVAVVALPYFGVNEAQFGTYWPRRGWLLLHIATGMVALFSGPIQIWLGLSDRNVRLHRRLGVIYMSAVVTSSVAAYYLAFHTDGGWVFGSGLVGLATAWLTTTGLAFLSIRRHLYEQHKEWMLRSYVVTFAFVWFRVLSSALQAWEVGTVQERIGLASWFCWAVPLLFAEAIIQGKKILAVKAD